jgi:hypothetical protein
MKITSPEESAYILARLCSEEFDNAAIQYYLKTSPTARDFRNRFTAAFFHAYLRVLPFIVGESGKSRTKQSEDFDAAREGLDLLSREFDAWMKIVERWDDAVKGFEWKAQKHRAALAAIEVIEAARDLARAHGAIRFDPSQSIPQS